MPSRCTGQRSLECSAAWCVRALENVRIIEADAVAGLERLLPARSVGALWMFFPDPWPKPRHHKRRLVTPGFADLAASRLKPGGMWRVATDSAGYADWIRNILEAIRASPTSTRTAKRRAGRPGRSASSSSGRWMRDVRSSILAIAVSTEATDEAAKVRWRLDIGYDGTNFSGWATQVGPAYGAGRAGELACPHIAARGAPASGLRGSDRRWRTRARPGRSP